MFQVSNKKGYIPENAAWTRQAHPLLHSASGPLEAATELERNKVLVEPLKLLKLRV